MDILPGDFFIEFRSKEFSHYKNVIEFLDSYQKCCNLSDLQSIINHLNLSKYANVDFVDIDSVYQKPLTAHTVTTAINIINRNNLINPNLNWFLIDFSDGAGSFECFDGIINSVQQAVSSFSFHDYLPSNLHQGTLENLNCWARRHGFILNKHNSQQQNWHLYMGGVTRACAEVFRLLTKEDIILFPTPTYGNLIALAEQYARVVFLPLNKATAWKLTPSLLAQYFKKNVKQLLIFVNPANPTGTVYSQREINMLADVVIQYDCLVLENIAHYGLTVDYSECQGLFQASPAAHKTLTVFGPSKTHGAAGWRLGILHVSDPYYAKRVKTNAFLTEYSDCKIYEAIINACYNNANDSQNYIDRNNVEYQLRHQLLELFIKGENVAQDIKHGELLVKYIKNMFPHKAHIFLTAAPGLTLLTQPQASFFHLLSFEGWKNKSLGNFKITTSFHVCQLLYALNIATLPDLTLGFHDHERLAVRISISNSFITSLKISHDVNKAKNIIAHYILGCTLERIKALWALLC